MVRDRLIGLARELEGRREVVTVLSGFDLRDTRLQSVLGDHGNIHYYVEAELNPGKFLVCSLYISWNESCWTVAPSVSVGFSQDYEVIKDFDERMATTLDEFIAHLRQVTSDLIDSVESIDLDA